VDDLLRPIWDFDDLDATERRFAALLDAEESGDGRAEILTQLARVEGLRGDFAAGDVCLDDAFALTPTGSAAVARIDLERGRLRRSSGDPASALPLFASAFTIAVEGGCDFLAADAAHMAALATTDGDGFEEWTKRGIELAEKSEAAACWLGPLLNNLGWHYFEDDRFDTALDAFERALRVRECQPDDPASIALARFAVGKALRALGRSSEAVPLLEQAVAWAEQSRVRDGWFHEELAEEYAAVGRVDDAREQALQAIPLLEDADPSFASDGERREHLRMHASKARLAPPDVG
jgi:tetratricopeptide (TPR) repeat protein